jgi:uncharacterized protein (UPF0147 family)
VTLAVERKNALKWAREFLRELLDPSKTKRVPREIRRRARSVLKHYPDEREYMIRNDDGSWPKKR